MITSKGRNFYGWKFLKADEWLARLSSINYKL